MFERSGEKIKKVAKIAFYINVVIASIILVISFVRGLDAYYGGEVMVLCGLVVFVIIIITAWVSSLFLHAFGGLVESNQQILELLQGNKIDNKDKRIINEISEKNEKNKAEGEYFCKLIDLFETGVITKEEFIEQKDSKWSNISKTIKDKTELTKIKQAYEKGLFSEKEYEEIKDATLNPESQIITWYVEFDASILRGIKIKANKNASDEEIEQLIRDQKYTSKIKKIYPLKNE